MTVTAGLKGPPRTSLVRRWFGSLSLSVKLLVCIVSGLGLAALVVSLQSTSPFVSALVVVIILLLALNSLLGSNRRLLEQATIDPVTGLRNRSSLYALLDQLIDAKSSPQQGFVVLLIDLDNFKEVNDLMGHAKGDFVLAQLSRRLTEAVVDWGQCFRLGGDEFIVICRGDLEGAELAHRASDLQAAVARDIVADGRTFRLTASLGITSYPHYAETRTALLKQCDMAMFQSKLKGGSTYTVYDRTMAEGAKRSAEMAETIQWALDEGKFIPYYQPQIDVKTKQVHGYELLLRMKDRQGQVVEPNDFIPVAERSRKIINVGRLVIEMGARDIQRGALGPKLKNLSINVSIIQLLYDEGFVDYVASVLTKYAIEAYLIELEITENYLAIDEEERVFHLLQALRRLGVRIALDDFGVGYSSLSRLQHLPVDTLKIDKTFVDNLPTNYSIPATIIALAKNLHLTIVAEGVETLGQSAWLERHGCDFLQGYYYGRPRPCGPSG